MGLASWTAKSKVVNGVQVKSNVRKFVKCLLSFYTDKNLRVLAPFAGKYRSGTIAHHIRAPSFKESIVPNTLSNIYQQITGEANSHTVFDSSVHFYFNFLQVYCYIVSQIGMESEFEGTITTPQICLGCYYTM